MKILVISDIHANLSALDAVLSEVGNFDAVWFLGDLVGYGPDPNECIALVRELPNLVCLKGNHDAAVAGEIDIDAFNAEARTSVLWARQAVNEDNLTFLKQLQPRRVTEEGVTLAHGSPRSPIWEYVLDTNTAATNFDYFETDLCFVGHTHVPVIFEEPGELSFTAGLLIPEPNTTIQLKPRAIINPGSVGQPRDRDPRAAYALFDPEALTLEYRRVAYDIASVQERMRAARLPLRHIQRLAAGW